MIMGLTPYAGNKHWCNLNSIPSFLQKKRSPSRLLLSQVFASQSCYHLVFTFRESMSRGLLLPERALQDEGETDKPLTAESSSTNQKREDIQGIRGWAICMVLAFHFFPTYCPNGYVGVDMFFVVSGFLMAMIITRALPITASSLSTFYYRRIKRILPMYYMVLFAVLLFVVVELPTFRSMNFASSRRALLLITNIRFSETDVLKGYEEMLNDADDLFTHTWSLCVEMQWYLLVPPLFFLQNLLPLPKTMFFLGVAYASMQLYFTVDSNTAFYNVFTRIWQFCAGMIAFVHDSDTSQATKTYQVIESNDSLQRKGKMDCTVVLPWFVFVLAIMVPFLWTPLPKRFLRVETTIMTAILIRLGKRHQTAVLTKKEVVYVGAISYALYLIHWPVFVVMKCWYPDNPLSSPVGVITSIFLASLTYRFYETNFLQWSTATICLLITTLFIGCRCLSSLSTENELFKSAKIDYNLIKVEDAAWNLTLMRLLNAAETPGFPHMWHKECNYSARFLNESIAPLGLCSMEEGNGTVDMLVAGNSFACNQGDVIYKVYKSYARRFYIFCVVYCEMYRPKCKVSFNFTRIVEELKPNVVFMIDRAILMKAPLNVTQPIDKDRIFGYYMNLLRFLEKRTKKIYILQGLPSCVASCSAKAVQYLKNGKALSTIKDGLIIKDEFFARLRILELGKRCKKCEIVDYMPMFVDKNGHYLGYNPNTNLISFSRSSLISLLYPEINEVFCFIFTHTF
ncbi:unnamed protein product [Cylicocyclus nassatus]|uniref:Acyltransferase n=1 Tax=Cylicocyclus nassatus TaxID=53992 RepID=A0AA36H8W2_CYLNA|nr:unnamed protein product [Cylicocyclus nassatus]